MPSSSQTVLTYLRSVVARQGTRTEDDRELLRRLVEQRDEEAFAALLQRHGPMVLSLARRVTGDEQIAEDVFQAVFVCLYRMGHKIRRPHSLSCWLHGVAHRLALQARREHGRRRQRETLARPSSPPNPLDELTAQEFLAVLDEELAKLPDKERAPLILCCLEGLSQEEAARRLFCSPGALRGRLERGRQHLRLRLEKRGLTLPAVLGGTLLFAGATSPVTAALARTTLQAATAGAAAPAVAALIEEAMRSMFIHRVKALGAIVMLLALAGTGVSMMSLQPQTVKENPLPIAVDDKPLSAKKQVDLFGDPLPKGALMRLGTLKQRVVNATLAVSADGKTIIGVRSGKSIQIWDAVTGELRQRHDLPGDSLNLFALSKDGCWMARIAAAPDRLEIWDVRTGQKVRDLTIKGTGKVVHTAPIAFSDDAKRVAAIASQRRKGLGNNEYEFLVRVWDLADGKEIFSKEVRNHVSPDVLALAPDGKHLLASFTSIDIGLYCWDIATGKTLWQYKKFGFFSPVRFTRDGKILSPSLGPQTLDLATGKTEKIAGAPPIKGDNRLTLTPNECTLLISTAQEVIVWDLVHGEELRRLPGAGEEAVVTPDGRAAITNNGMLQRWDLATGKAIWSNTAERGHIGEVTAAQFSADGKRLVSASTDGTVRLWDTSTGRPLRIWSSHTSGRPSRYVSPLFAGVKLLDISADGRRVVSADTGTHIMLWDIASDKEVRIIALPPAERGEASRRFYHVRLSPDGRRIAGFFGPIGFIHRAGQPMPKPTDKLALWDADTGNLLEMQVVEKSGGGILSPDGHTLLTGNTLKDVATAKKIVDLPGLGQSMGWGFSGAFSRDGALIVSHAQEVRRQNNINFISADGVRVWETATGKIIAHVKTKSWVAQTCFHPDNRFVATNDLHGIQIFEVRSGKVVARFTMPETIRSGITPGSYAGCLAFSRDGRRLATGHPDSTILLWDVRLSAVSIVPLSAQELEAYWADLADADAAKVWQAVGRLTEAPKETLTFLRDRVKPFPTAPAELTRKLLADLDSDAFAIREAAVKRLKELGLQAEPALRAALEAKPSLEQRRRIENLLMALSEAQPTVDELRQLRALIALERIGTPEARRVLEDVAKGPPSARLTRQARAALSCLP